ncbi:MAG: von Willebrand factor type A domain-containing protein [Bacteroidetes bacterium]|nr:von Willebrand factor type A domain-containing protein [Bacteroidota bacterium]MBL0030970.1 von Willebrand factor type A domain-containing protein [Bacteroidota bacterium]MBP6426191.1 von Willebrand factor type A domain-containing protein [Bacteroidia bacterium]MBP6656237.1 von Willebrand factor type A domain-containing protein [Bacteroidia bacterium]MBP9789589.1 von Willebrand factor type A domain-containing protein [Bacteroidia bacterium]
MKALVQMIIYIMIVCTVSTAQTYEIRGRVHTSNPDEGIPFASIVVYRDTANLFGTTTDIDGNFSIKPDQGGLYNVKATCVGFQPIMMKNILIAVDSVAVVDIVMTIGTQLNQIVIREYKVPLIEKEQIIQAPTRDVNSISSQAAGVYQVNESEPMNIRGSRSDANAYYVDGIKVRGSASQIPERKVSDNEEYSLITENQFNNVKRRPLSTFSIDVDAASYSNIRRILTAGMLPPKDAVRIEEMINYFNYEYAQPKDQEPISITTEIGNCSWNPEHKLVKIGLKGRSIEAEKLPPNNLVFLIDVSGSMMDENKLPLIKRSFRLLVQQLRPEDKVSIVVYAGSSGLVLSPTSGKEKELIMQKIDVLQAGGSTAGGEGIQLAYDVAKENFMKDGNNRVILATDGDFNVGVSSDAELVSLIEKKRDMGIFLTVLGFGTGNYKDSKMEGLADKGNGNFAYVDNILEAQKVFVKEMGATLNTIAKDVKLQIEFNPVHVKAYRLVGYENRLLADEDFNDDKKDAGELGSGKTVTALYEIIPAKSKESIDNIDTLKYQKTVSQDQIALNEMMTIKFRYKDPKGSESKLIVHPLLAQDETEQKSSEDFRFASSVAEFGMILRDSKFKGKANFKNILTAARESKGIDTDGYRAEFIKLVETAEIVWKASDNVSVK